MSDHDKVPIHPYDPTGEYPGSAKAISPVFSSELFADAAIDFLETRGPADEDPFLCYVSFTAPHDPRMAPEPFAGAHDPGSIPVPPNFAPEHPFPIGHLRVRDEVLAPHPRTEAVVQEHIAGYWAMIEHLDTQLGRILATLEERGLADDTIVVLAGDNGLAVGQHGLLGKQNLYEHSAGVPLILTGPGVPAGESEALCYLHDLFPTLCDLTGVATPDTVTARSLAPIVRGDADLVRDHLMLSYRTKAAHAEDTSYMRAVVTPRWKYLRSLHGAGEEAADVTRLFDLASDPWETEDLSTAGDQTDRLAALSALLDAELAAVGDPVRPDRSGWNIDRDTGADTPDSCDL